MPGRRNAVALAAAAACLLLTTACGERSEPTGAASDLFPITVTSADDRTVSIPEPVRRIALVDRDARPMVDGLGVRLAVPVESNGNIDEGELRSFQADLLLATHAVARRESLSRLADLADAPVYVVGDSSLREVERSLGHLGTMVGRPVVTRRQVAEIETGRRRAGRLVANRPRASVFVDLGSLTTASDRTLIGDLIRLAGGRNIAAEIPDGGPFDPAELRRADPDVYIAADGITTLESLRADPSTRRLRAVKTGRVLTFDPLELAPGPHIGDTLARLASGLHPDATR